MGDVRAYVGSWLGRRLFLSLAAATLFLGMPGGIRAQGRGQESAAATGPVYERVVKSGKLKAAFITYPPACMKDTVSGKMSGIFVDVLEKAASNCGLTVEWTEEVGWGSQIEGLDADRYDIVGSPVWANPKRGKLTTLSEPVYFSGIGVYVRVDDKRFDKNLGLINAADVRIATIDGETADLIAKTQFSKAERVSLPQLTDISQMLLNVSSKKADVVFAEPYYGYEFLKHNPGTLRNIAESKPLRIFGNCYMMKRGEYQLKQMIDVAVEDLLNSGYVDEVLQKYEPAPGLFYRVAAPYATR